MKSTLRAWVAATLFACHALLPAHTGDHTFLEISLEEHLDDPALLRANTPSAIMSAGRKVGNLLPALQNKEGRTLLPKGATCDSVDLTSRVLTVKFTLPAGFAKGDMDLMDTETISQLFTYHFAHHGQFEELRCLARAGKAGEYLPLDEFVAERPGLAETLANPKALASDPPGTKGPDYEEHYETLRNEWQQAHTGQGPVGTTGQPMGALAGRTVYIGAGHGWTWTGSSWGLQRPLLLSMCEDYGNVDQLNFLAHYLFNAGATVVPLRPLGYQTNEVVLDEDSAAVTLSGTWTLGGVDANNYGSAQRNRNIAGAATETHTATYTPNIPQAGFYPVYCYANSGTNRVPGQLYKVRHAGGETQVRVNHRRIGRGWVWLGNYYFNAGSSTASGSVVISNLLPPGGTTSQFVIADAIRFGNGEGDIDRNGATAGGQSGYEREAEASAYWIHTAQVPTTVVNVTDAGSDNGDTIGGPPRMSAFMRADDGQGYNGDIYLGFHSNASSGSARGSVGLITNSGGTPANQATFAAQVSNELDNDANIEDANWPSVWGNYGLTTYTSGFGEISNTNLGGEMCGTIIEVAFHDNTQDAQLLLDPRVRNVAGRSQYRAIVRYFNQFNSGPLTFLPEPPVQVRAVNSGPGQATVSWAAGPSGGANGAAATGYRVYRSSNGLAFDSGTAVAGTSSIVSGLSTGQTVYFRVAGTNAGGESLPSETVAVRTGAVPVPVLIVNGYDRIDRLNGVPDFPSNALDDQNWRLRLERNNSYNYARIYGPALAAANQHFDSCSNEAIEAGLINLANYHAVVWYCGEESSGDQTFSSAERMALQNYFNGGGRIFASGAEIGWDLDWLGNASTQSFYNNVLKADYAADDGGSYATAGVAATIMAGINMTFSPGADVYDADYPDRLTAVAGGTVCANYSAPGSGGAIVQFPTGTSNGRVVTMGFPFECINSSASRNQVMAAVMNFFGSAPAQVADWSIY